MTHRNPGRSVAVENNEWDDTPYAPDPSAVKDNSDPLALLRMKSRQLDLVQRQAQRVILHVVSQQFRLVTGVSKHDKWPKWGETMPGMAVNFEARVDESVNPDLLVRVAEVSMQQLKTHPVKRLTFSGNKSFPHSPEPLCHPRDVDERAKRQIDVSTTARIVVPTYLETHGIDPGPLIMADFMSDEASGPEDDENEEAVIEWRRQMAEKAGITGKTDAQLARMSVFEVIKPNWRSDELTKIYRELWELYNSSLPLKSLRMTVERVRDTGRSSDKIPNYAPYNFGVNIHWYEKMQETHSRYLVDWLQHSDPAGFGENAAPTEESTADVVET
ncbi:hypothetical protein DICSQDRAFT_128587 [Dichomitus squalens LYAD-421 SS1]|uniref:Uncharacterized protein n=1 Tax=Dichomitus squalens (strain LYAD-421) TaxID=732165 RepID=R7SS50_DICSQ|nr:uncharacterized protein DICSQDRAFT_128587 [Dichomitus squalens LYAD-421 SS1]EJF59019.1 hypothetical protein DICSQDRAFT_128587 [Dichomitus squalens LYAD-421 SS1]